MCYTYDSLNRVNVNKLEGTGYYGGASAYAPLEILPFGVGGGFDITVMGDEEENKVYGALSSSKGLSYPPSLSVETHAGMSETVSLFTINIFDVFDDLCSII